jgi:hypothetical protein
MKIQALYRKAYAVRPIATPTLTMYNEFMGGACTTAALLGCLLSGVNLQNSKQNNNSQASYACA